MPVLAGDHVQVLVGGYELTGDHQRVSINDMRKTHEATVFGDRVRNFIPGQRACSLIHAGFLNPATARSHPVLKANNVAGVVSVLVGQNGDPVNGDPVYSLLALQGRYDSQPEADKAVPFGAAFASKSGSPGGWGVALAVPTSFTNTTTGTGIDNGAATTSGGAAFLHLLQTAASDTYLIIVEGATDSGFTTGLVTLATFSLNASSLGSERVEISGSIPRYVRWKATRTGSAGNTVKLAVNFIRY